MPRDPLAEIALLEKRQDVCRARQVLDRVPEDLRPGVVAAMAPESGLSGAAIARWLKREGFVISDRTIIRHRGGQCACA